LRALPLSWLAGARSDENHLGLAALFSDYIADKGETQREADN
jgi:hypothetical protein